jgi:hypothetical protein
MGDSPNHPEALQFPRIIQAILKHKPSNYYMEAVFCKEDIGGGWHRSGKRGKGCFTAPDTQANRETARLTSGCLVPVLRSG